MRSKLLGLALLGSLLLAVRAEEDELEGENGEEWEDNSVYKCIIESCSGWRLNKLPEVKNFIYGDFESKYDRTIFKKIPGKAPEMIFYTQSGKELERLNIEKFDRYGIFVEILLILAIIHFLFQGGTKQDASS